MTELQGGVLIDLIIQLNLLVQILCVVGALGLGAFFWHLIIEGKDREDIW